jgi:hypothetical protein
MSGRGDAERVLAELLGTGAIPAIEAGRLRVEAPPGALTPARREALAGCLAEVRALVAARWRSREECVARMPCRRMSPCSLPVDGRPCLVPATCCVCGAPLSAGRRYLCEACAEARVGR